MRPRVWTYREVEQKVVAAGTPVLTCLAGRAEADLHLGDVASRSVPLGAGGQQNAVVRDLGEKKGPFPTSAPGSRQSSPRASTRWRGQGKKGICASR